MNDYEDEKNWQPELLMSFRVSFQKFPVAHTLLHMSGSNAARVIRQALHEFAFNHGHPSIDPTVQEEMVLRGTEKILQRAGVSSQNLYKNKKAQQHEGLNTTASSVLATAGQTIPIETSVAPSPPKTPSKSLDFGSTPDNTEQSGTVKDSQKSDEGTKLIKQWFKDDDKY
jgi:hypothetical protein